MATTTNNYKHPEYLVETDWLEQHLKDTHLRIFDCSVKVVANPDQTLAKQFPFVFESGRDHYDQGHIPNAGFIDVPNHLSDVSSSLPLMLASQKQFVTAMSEYGIDKDVVLAAIEDDGTRIINALPTPIHTGSSDIVFGRKGRIVNSVNVPYMDLHHADTGCYLPAEQLQQSFHKVDAAYTTRLITYCGGGIASANSAFALKLLGYNNVAVYDGSMLEWGNDKTLPMEMG